MGIYQGNLDCFVLISDITNFSGATESFLKKGKKGCEKLRQVISSVFNPAIDTVYECGGFISSFAGDGFTALFEAHGTELNSILSVCSKISDIEFSEGETVFRYKTGLSRGTVSWRIIETQHQKLFLFEGEAIERAAYFKSKALTGKASIDFRIREKNLNEDRDFLSQTKRCSNPPEKNHSISEDNIQPDYEWINPSIRTQRDIGEFRDIVSCFILFEKSPNSADLLKKTVDLSYDYGGYLNKIDFGDKGGMALVVFGAPIETQNKFVRAADFALALRKIKHSEVKAGISFGKAFCGFVGNDKRAEYTVLGSTVNISSRIAEKSAWREIAVDSSFRSKVINSHNLYPLGEETLKNIRDKIQIFILSSKKSKEKSEDFLAVPLIGRKKEMASINRLYEKTRQEKKLFAVIMTGETGIGKSRVIEEFNRKSIHSADKTIRLECEDPVKKPFGPYLLYLKNRFGIEDSDSRHLNRVRFEDFLDKRAKELLGQGEDKLASEIKKSAEYISFLLGFGPDDKAFFGLDSKSKYDLCFNSLKNIFISECLGNNTIIEIFKAHEADSDSLLLTNSLVRYLEKNPVFLIIETKYEEFNSGVPELNSSQTEVIKIGKMSRNECEDLLKEWIKSFGKEYSGFFEKILSDCDFYCLCEGNPFYVENIARFLFRENSGYDSLNIQKFLSEPLGIKELILSRFDLFESGLKETVRAASVIGNSFTYEMFKSVFGVLYPEFDASEYLARGVELNVFSRKLDNFFFSSAMTREVIYGVQMNPFLGKTHRLAAEFLEEYTPEDRFRFEAMGDHYSSSDDKEKAVNCFIEAANSFFNVYLNQRALHCLDKAENLISRGSGKELFEINYLRSSIFRLTGKWENAKKSLTACLKTSSSEKLREEFCLSLEMLSSIERNRGNLSKALKHAGRGVKIASNLNNESLQALFQTALGHIYYRSGDYEKALGSYSSALFFQKKTGDINDESKILSNMANIYSELGDFKKSVELNLEGLELCRKTKDLKTESIILLNLGTCRHSTGNFPEALENYIKSLEIKEKIMDADGIAILKNNIGYLHEIEGSFETALKYYDESAELSFQIGDKRSLSISLGNKANVLYSIGDYAKAEGLLEESVILSRESGSKYNLSFFLFRLSELYCEMYLYKKSESLLDEALKTSSEVGRFSVVFKCEILRCILDYKTGRDPEKAASNLFSIIQKSKDDDIRSFAAYNLFKLTKDVKHAETALAEFKKSCEKSPVYDNIKRKEELQEFILKSGEHYKKEDK